MNWLRFLARPNHVLAALFNWVRSAYRTCMLWFSRIPMIGLLAEVPLLEKGLALRDGGVIWILGTAALWLPGAFTAVHASVPVTLEPVWSAVGLSAMKGEFLLLCPSIIAPALLLFFGPWDNRPMRGHQLAILGASILVSVLTVIEFAILVSAGINDKSFLSTTSYWLLAITSFLLYFNLLLERVPNDAPQQAQLDEAKLLDAVLKARGGK